MESIRGLGVGFEMAREVREPGKVGDKVVAIALTAICAIGALWVTALVVENMATVVAIAVVVGIVLVAANRVNHVAYYRPWSPFYWFRPAPVHHWYQTDYWVDSFGRNYDWRPAAPRVDGGWLRGGERQRTGLPHQP